MVESSPISKIQELCRQRNIVIPENNRRNRHLLMDCDLFAQQLNIPTGPGKPRQNMITYLKKIAGKETINEYIPTASNNEVVEKTANNFKYYQINSRGIRKILMNRNDEYKEYYLTLEDLWNELNDICDELNQQLKQELILKNKQILSNQEEIKNKDEEIKNKNQYIEQRDRDLQEMERKLNIEQLKAEFFSDIGEIKKTGEYIYIWTNRQYCLQSLFKIGRTQMNPQQRLQNSESSHIENIILLRTIDCGDSEYLEKQIHSMLRDFRYKKNREFFKINYNILLKIIDVIINGDSGVIDKINDIINEYKQLIDNGQIPQMHEDVKRILEDVDYFKCFFDYLRSKGIKEIKLKDVDDYIQKWQLDQIPQIPVGFKTIIQRKFKDSQNIIQYDQYQIEKIQKPLVTYLIRED